MPVPDVPAPYAIRNALPVTWIEPSSDQPRETSQPVRAVPDLAANGGFPWPESVSLPSGTWRQSDQLAAGVYAFSRRLAHSGQPLLVHQEIVDAIARATGAEQAALATYDEHHQALSIVATHGYPAVLVEDLRIRPGTGVLGRVFATRQSLLVTDAARVRPSRARRLRYRTPSFIAVPLFAGRHGLGVVCLADRADGQVFDRRDLTTARALAAAATLALGRARLAARARELAHAAAIEPLTGLFNRRYFETRLDEEIQRARRYGLDMALLAIDADNFKSYNDLLGHPTGDRILRAMADVLRRSIRAFDVCTRFGGEEFAILMPGSNAEAALHSAERIRQRIAEYRFEPLLARTTVHPTISIGVAVLEPDLSALDLIARADRALYAAKAAGKNCVRLAKS